MTSTEGRKRWEKIWALEREREVKAGWIGMNEGMKKTNREERMNRGREGLKEKIYESRKWGRQVGEGKMSRREREVGGCWAEWPPPVGGSPPRGEVLLQGKRRYFGKYPTEKSWFREPNGNGSDFLSTKKKLEENILKKRDQKVPLTIVYQIWERDPTVTWGGRKIQGFWKPSLVMCL